MNILKNRRLFGLCAAAILAIGIAASCVPATVHAEGDRELELNPNTGAIVRPKLFLPGNGIVFATPYVAVDMTKNGSTDLFTVPAGHKPANGRVNGLEVSYPANTLKFFVTAVQVEFVQIAGASDNGVFSVRNDSINKQSLGSTSISYYTAATGTVLTYVPPATSGGVLQTGDVQRINVTTAFPGATVANVRARLIGYYQ